MDLRELYDQIGGSYDEAIGRLRTESLVGTFVVRFAADPSIPNLLDAWSRGDEQAAFEAAHAAKGVCQNLALTSLGEPASAICEALRPGNDDLRAATDVDARIGELRDAYERAIDAIDAFERGR